MRKPLHHHLVDYFFPHPRNNHRPHLFSTISIAVLVAAIITFEAGYLVQTKLVYFNTNFLAAVLPGVLADLTNESRAALGIAPVARDALLDVAAQAAAEDMAAKGYFAHVSPDGRDPWYWLNQVGYQYRYAGQNLAVNFTDSVNVETAWMESLTHRANIVKREYTRVGFGTAQGVYEGQATTFVVEFFATPTEAAPAAIVTPVETRPLQNTSLPTSTARVLGSETGSGAAAAAAPSWFSRVLASPQTTLLALLTALFAVISLSFIITMLMRGKVQHRSVVQGGVFLLLFIPGAMLLCALLTGPVQLNADAGAASAIKALP